ncbi:MAG TPA: PhoU domain-containing protein [Thermoplasmata archaeon]|nr:PhoU domain-containing protein [Thermoplasmata archaeon]
MNVGVAGSLGRGSRSGSRALGTEFEGGPRVVQRMGGVTLGVSLPRVWVERARVTVGSPIHVESLRDGSLRLAAHPPELAPRPRTIQVASGSPPEHLFRELIGSFVSGAEVIRVEESGGLTPASRGVVRSFQRRTGHVEVFSEQGSALELRVIAEDESISLQRRVRRSAELVEQAHRQAGEALAERSGIPVVDWQGSDDEVDRETWFIQRQLSRIPVAFRTGAEPVEGELGALDWWSIARSLERIGDHAVLIGEASNTLSRSPTIGPQRRALRQIHDQAIGQLHSVMDTLATGEVRRANELLDTGEALAEAIRTLAGRLPVYGRTPPSSSGAAVTIDRILQSIDRTVAYTQDIAEALLDAKLASEHAGAEGSASASPTPPPNRDRRDSQAEGRTGISSSRERNRTKRRKDAR